MKIAEINLNYPCHLKAQSMFSSGAANAKAEMHIKSRVVLFADDRPSIRGLIRNDGNKRDMELYGKIYEQGCVNL